MQLRTENVAFCKKKKEIRDIYLSSFPKEERMPFPMMVAMSFLWNTEFLAFFDGETPCGLIYMASMGRLSFIMFFAVDEKLRSKGYGSSILDLIQKRHPKNKIVVSIEPCDKDADDVELRQRRRAFYGRCGYERTGYFMKLGGQRQEILIKNGTFSKPKFILFFILYSCLAAIPRIWKEEQ